MMWYRRRVPLTNILWGLQTPEQCVVKQRVAVVKTACPTKTLRTGVGKHHIGPVGHEAGS